MVKTVLPGQGAWIQALVGELIPHVPCGRKKEKKKKRPKLEAERALIDSLEVLSKQNPCQRNELIGENPCACDSERALVDCRNGFL